MDVDFWGVVNGTKVFLPHLIASGDGHVINVSSIFGLFSVPGQAAYNAAKFAVRGFTEALRQEMVVAGHPVKVTTVHPGGIKTSDRAQHDDRRAASTTTQLTKTFDKKLTDTTPEKAAKIILDGVRKNRARVLVGPDAKALDIIVRLTGSGYQRLFSTVMSRMVPERALIHCDTGRGCDTVAMDTFAGKVAVVTGAGSGIGQALAIELARRGAKLAISDIDTEGLARTEERLAAIGAP